MLSSCQAEFFLAPEGEFLCATFFLIKISHENIKAKLSKFNFTLRIYPTLQRRA